MALTLNYLLKNRLHTRTNNERPKSDANRDLTSFSLGFVVAPVVYVILGAGAVHMTSPRVRRAHSIKTHGSLLNRTATEATFQP